MSLRRIASTLLCGALFAALFVTVTAPPAAAQVASAPVCLYAISKDLCGTRLFGGTWSIPSCVPGAPNCSNLVGDDATFRGSWTSSSGGCGAFAEVPCDEAPEFGDLLEATVDVRTQRHTSCQARGSFDGKFKLADSLTNATIATGELVATLGVGTHRRTCSGACGTGECETCHDARIIDQQFNWEVGSEGTLRGKVVDGRYRGCSFTASFQGNFITDGDSRGPQAPDYSWGFCGAVEGVLECPCGIVEDPS